MEEAAQGNAMFGLGFQLEMFGFMHWLEVVMFIYR